MKRFLLCGTVILITWIIASCSSTRKAENMKSDPKAFLPGPKAVIYQTKKDYSNLVPVILSDDKKSIESYPDVKDVYFEGNLACPIKLHNGYLLDKRGISVNVAFINVTYEEYSRLPKTPDQKELMNLIIDARPLVSMYSCGIRSSYQNIEKELNSKIDAGDFSTFTKIK